MPGFVQADDEEDKEAWELLIIDQVPENIKERRDHYQGDNDGGAAMGGVAQLPQMVQVN